MAKFKDLLKEGGPVIINEGNSMVGALARLGLEVVKVDKGVHNNYICRPRVKREILIRRIEEMIRVDNVRCWQEWVLKNNKLTVAVVIDVPESVVNTVWKEFKRIAKRTMEYPDKVPLSSLAGRNPRDKFDPSAKKGAHKQAGAHPCIVKR